LAIKKQAQKKKDVREKKINERDLSGKKVHKWRAKEKIYS